MVNVPVAVLGHALVFTIGHVVLTYRSFGRDIYAVGGNKQAAIASGIDANKRIRQVYMISGLLAALAACMMAGRVGSVQVNLGDGYIFTVMAAAVIGGVSLQRRARHDARRAGRRAAALDTRPGCGHTEPVCRQRSGASTV